MDRTTMLRSHIFVRAGLAATTVALGLTSAVTLAGPANAATAPTIVTPAYRTGFGRVAITGTATPGATVQLFETAYSERATGLYAADDWEHGGGPVTAKADTAGHYTIMRYVDTGFQFAVKSEGLTSPTTTVRMKVLPSFWITTAPGGVVQAHTEVSPMAEKLTVSVERLAGTSTWTTVAKGPTTINGQYTATFGGQKAGTYTYRAAVAADPKNAVLANSSPAVTVSLDGSSGVKAGAVRFNRIQYAAATLDGEYFRLTNTTAAAINLAGWTVRDAAGNAYTFGSHTVAAGHTVYVHTGQGVNGRPDSAQLYWGKTSYIWNNSGDSATLRTSDGATIDSCRYTGSSKGYTSC
jgi:Lamin Tail Domain